jgi:outer membrane receptor protein involved in Fe transport
MKRYDGPWGSPENLDHKSVWAKYLTNTSFGRASVTLSGYHATWDPTEQMPERAIGTAVCPDAFCSLDPTAIGSTKRWILTSQLEGSDWDANVYAQTYDWHMTSNPTYDYQIGQFDKRWTLGANANKMLVDNGDFELKAGADFRYDDAEKVGVSHFDQGHFVEEISNNEIAEGSVGAFTEATWYATDDLRVMAGLRGDYYDFDVTAFNANSYEGNETDAQISPKVALAYTLTDSLELYSSWGKGFHSNDARGVVNPTDPVPGLSEGTGYEVGARTTVGDFKFTAAYWWLDSDSELIFVGDSNAVEPKGGSEREGVELTAFWQPLSWLGIDAVYTQSDARYLNNPEGRYVENALEEAAQLGISASRDNWDVSLRMRYLGPYALLADNSQRADPLTTVNLRGAYNWESLTLFAEVINLLDSEDKEIVYSYEAIVPGLDPAGASSENIDCSVTNCRLSRQTAPRMLRMGVSYKF